MNEDEYKYMVCTQCITYNHAPYIEDTLNGFVLQETTFPVVYCVIDDASIDGEQNVIRHWCDYNLKKDESYKKKQMPYGELIFGKSKNNANNHFALLLLLKNHFQAGRHEQKMSYIDEWMKTSKYHALCEGDDYWVAPDKLQIQVDFLDKNPDYVMCHTNYRVVGGHYRNSNIHKEPDDNYFIYNLRHDLHIGTLTVLYRAQVEERIPKLWKGKGWPMGDLPLWIEISHEGKVKYFTKVTAAYRWHQDSSSHGNFEKEKHFLDATVEVRQFYANYFGVELKNNGYNTFYYDALMKLAYKHHKIDIAEKCFSMAKENKMLSKKLLFFYFVTKWKIAGEILHVVYKAI